MKKLIDWSPNAPKREGTFWFYGDPFQGAMGIDYRDDAPPIEPKMYLVAIMKCSNGFLAVANGHFVPLTPFSKKVQKEGYVGYWKTAILPDPPNDSIGLWK